MVMIRRARSGDNAPLIITLPKEFVEKCNLKAGEKKRIYTDGKKICMDDGDKPKLN
ncbi:MAG: AbrB/MazE/SpoVT family DNA-binding domain-containing protein [Candidatus Nitrosocosmicus sp.]|nr:AbrB/MazE/SpoVT family DNA-binding domain-containing protein [Candidatus Nitrosocosmicus sp.]